MECKRDLSVFGDNDLSFQPDDTIQNRFRILFKGTGKDEDTSKQVANIISTDPQEQMVENLKGRFKETGSSSEAECTEYFKKIFDDILHHSEKHSYDMTGYSYCNWSEDEWIERFKEYINEIVINPENYLPDVVASSYYNECYKNSENGFDYSWRYDFSSFVTRERDSDKDRLWIPPFLIRSMSGNNEIDLTAAFFYPKTSKDMKMDQEAVLEQTPTVSARTNFCGYTIQALYKDRYSLRLFSKMSPKLLTKEKSKRILTFEHFLGTFYKVKRKVNQETKDYYKCILDKLTIKAY